MARKPSKPVRTDADALLAAVWADPHKDLPRLVYADFIEERGDAERAEFIRLQIAREVAEAAGDEVTFAAWRRESELFGANKRSWLAETADEPTPGRIETADFREAMSRGFAVRHRNYSASLLPKRALDPPLTSLELSWVAPGGLTKLARSPHAATIGRLESVLHTSYEAGKCADLAELVELTELRLQVYGAGGLALTKWVVGLDLPNLRRLAPPRCESPGDLVWELAASPAASRLTELDLRHTTLDSVALRLLSGSASFGRLHTLRVGDGTTDGMAVLLASPLGLGLREIDVTDHDWLWLFCHALAAAPPPGLRVLKVASGYDTIAPEEARLLASIPLDGLRELHVSPEGHSPELGLLKSAFGDRLRPAHLWADIRPA